jgi:hypothetical protein
MAERVTLAAINRAIRASGGAEALAKAAGYFHFHGGDAAAWPQSGVYVARLDQMTLAQWVAEWRRLRDEHLRSRT